MRAEQRGRISFHNLLVILLLMQLKTHPVLPSIPPTPLTVICLWFCPLSLLFLLCRKIAVQTDPWTQVGQAGLAQALDRPAGGRRPTKDKEGGHLPAALEVLLSPCLKGDSVMFLAVTVLFFLYWCRERGKGYCTSLFTWALTVGGNRGSGCSAVGGYVCHGIVTHALWNHMDTVAMELWEQCSSTSLWKEKPQVL